MKGKIKIIFVAQDSGGFNAILPVIKKLKRRKEFISKTILANQSRDIAKKYRISYLDGNLLTNKDLKRLLENNRPSLIFTATSQGLSIEKRIAKIAKVQKIKTIALIDFWSNYKFRFSDPGTENLIYLPDYILAIDEIMKKEMITQGFDSKKIIITGSPFFDSFLKITKEKQSKKIISFFSQFFSELLKKEHKTYPGFNEIQVFEDFIKTLEALQVKLPIKIKFHPKTKRLSKFNRIIRNSKLKISIETKLSSEDLIKKSKLVLGMNSVVLFEAAMIGKPVVSYQPGLNRPDPLISNRVGLSRAVYQKRNLYSTLEKMLLTKAKKKNLKLIKKYIRNKSTDKVINFIEKQI